MNRFIIIFFCAILILLSDNSNAELDASRLSVDRSHAPVLRWDNIKDAPFVLAGKTPARHIRLHRHTSILSPGEFVLLHVPATTVIRVEGVDCQLVETDLNFWMDNGSGTQLHVLPRRTEDGRSLLVESDSAHPQFLKIVRPQCSQSFREIAIYFSRYERVVDLKRGRREIEFSLPSVQIQHERDQVQTHYLLKTGEIQTINLKGPARLELKSRYAFRADESNLEQTYRIDVSDGDHLRWILEHETAADHNGDLWIDGSRRTVGRLRHAYIEVPTGDHHLTLTATANIYLQTLAYDDSQFLIEKMNRPKSDLHRSQGSRDETGAFSPWILTPEATDVDEYFMEHFPWRTESIAWRLARDNRFREGGLNGYLLLRETASLHPEVESIRSLAEEWRSWHSFYRDFYPTHLVGDEQTYEARFSTRHLLAPNEQERDLNLGEQHVRDAIDQVGQARFFPIGQSEANANLYVLAHNRPTTLLRVLFDRRYLLHDQPIFVKLDDQPPILLNVSRHICKANQTAPSLAETGLSALATRQPTILGTGSSLLSQSGGSWTEVSWFECILPHPVTMVRMWAPGDGGNVAHGSLQLRTSRPFRLSESQFFELTQRNGIDLQEQALWDWITFTDFQSFRSCAGEMHLDKREVINHLFGWYERIESSAQWYQSAVQPPLKQEHESSNKAPQPLLRPISAESYQSIQVNQPVLKLEQAAKNLYEANTQKKRRLALLRRVQALYECGEMFLYERQLRGLFLYDTDSELRFKASLLLRELYRDQGDLLSLQGLLCSEILRNPDPHLIAELAHLFWEDGKDELALWSSLLIPGQMRSPEIVLGTSLRLEWWSTFDAHLQCLPPEHHIAWQLYRAMARGDETEVIASIHQMRESEHPEAGWLEEAFNIRQLLNSPSLEDRIQSVFQMETWHQDVKLPSRWAEDSSIRTRSSGAALVVAKEHQTHAHFQLAKADSPLLLEVQGPVRLKFEMRPLSTDPTLAVNDWIDIRCSTKHWPVPVIDNYPSDGLSLVNHPEQPIGTGVDYEIELGPGRHRIVVQPKVNDTLVRTFYQQPHLPVDLVPRLTPEIVEAVLTGSFGIVYESDRKSSFWITTPDGNAACRNQNLTPIEMPVDLERLMDQVPETLREAVRLRLIGTDTIGSESSLRQVDWSETNPSNLDSGTNQIQARRSMEQLLYAVDFGQLSPEDVRAVAEQIRYQFPTDSKIASLHRRLTRGGYWKRVTQVQQSAGIQRIEVTGQQTESPSQRVRQSLLSPLQPGEFLIYGGQALVVQLHNKKESTLDFTLTTEFPDYLPTTSVQVLIEIDGAEQKRVTLSSLKQHHFQKKLGLGQHTVRFQISESYANQFVRIRTVEQRFKNGSELAVPLIRSMERDYFVATQEQPLIMNAVGPACYRIDERTPDGVLSTYHFTRQQGEEIKVVPHHKCDHALFRVFERKYNTEVIPSKPLRIQRSISERPNSLVDRYQTITPAGVFSNQSLNSTVPFDVPLGKLNPMAQRESTLLDDQLAMGLQQSGTLSLGMSYVQRRPLDEGINGNQPDRFIQNTVSYRHRDELSRTWKKLELHYRDRDPGNGSLGVIGNWSHDPDWMSASISMSAAGYFQNPGETRAGRPGSDEWALFWKGRIRNRSEISPELWHTTNASFFARTLSLSQNPYRPARVDQDVFTSYKARHRIGVVLSDTLVWEPFHDTQFYTGASISTNEDFHDAFLDHGSWKLGWRQMLGQCDVNAYYRLTGFFNDDHRRATVYQNLIGLEGNMDLWWRDRHWYDLIVQTQFNLDDGTSTVMAGGTVYLDAGRNYLDYEPGEKHFLKLREQNTRWARNNRIIHD